MVVADKLVYARANLGKIGCVGLDCDECMWEEDAKAMAVPDITRMPQQGEHEERFDVLGVRDISRFDRRILSW